MKQQKKEEKGSSGATSKVYKHNFVNCHLTLAPGVVIVLQKPIKESWGYYRTTDENIKELILKSPYFGRESGFRILEASEAETNRGKTTKGKQPKYKSGVMSGIK